MTKRIHTNGNYTTVGMLEVMNEPVRSGKWKAEATDMRKNFYPKAFHRIQAMEGYLDVAESDRLHIQFMVRLPTNRGPFRLTIVLGQIMGCRGPSRVSPRKRPHLLRRPSVPQLRQPHRRQQKIIYRNSL